MLHESGPFALLPIQPLTINTINTITGTPSTPFMCSIIITMIIIYQVYILKVPLKTEFYSFRAQTGKHQP